MHDVDKLITAFYPREERIWDALWQNRPLGRVAVAVDPSEARVAAARAACSIFPQVHEDGGPTARDESWRQALAEEIVGVYAHMQLPGDYYPALNVPRFVHGQSQGICDVFGARLEPHPQEKDLLHVCPLAADPRAMADLRPGPLEASRYWGAVEWIRYARTATHGLFAFRNPVLAGPLDTANYLLGTTVLMEWLYGEPEALGHLLDTITGVIVEMLHALQRAAGGRLAGEDFACMRGGPCLCSECRSLISREHYEAFEAPRLRRIGREFGPYGFHSCGSWERTVTSVLTDENLRAMHGQVRENDLAELCRLTGGRKTLAIGPSINLDGRFTWGDVREFYDHVLHTVSADQPIEMRVREEDVPYLNETYRGSALWRPLVV